MTHNSNNIFRGNKISPENVWHLTTMITILCSGYGNCSVKPDGFIERAPKGFLSRLFGAKEKARIEELIREDLVQQLVLYKTKGVEDKAPNIQKVFGDMIRAEILDPMTKGDLNTTIEILYVYFLKKRSMKAIAYEKGSGMAILLEGSELEAKANIGDSLDRFAQSLDQGKIKIFGQTPCTDSEWLNNLWLGSRV